MSKGMVTSLIDPYAIINIHSFLLQAAFPNASLALTSENSLVVMIMLRTGVAVAEYSSVRYLSKYRDNLCSHHTCFMKIHAKKVTDVDDTITDDNGINRTKACSQTAGSKLG